MSKELKRFIIKKIKTHVFILLLLTFFMSSFILSCKKDKPQYSSVIESETDLNADMQTVENFNDSYIESEEKIYIASGRITIKNNHLEYLNNWSGYFEEYDIALEPIGSMLYINFYYDGEFLFKEVKHGQKRYLVLYINTGYVFIYDENNECVFDAGSYATDLSWIGYTATATSELIEGDTTYGIENLRDPYILKPWAEGKVGSGIGEKIILKTKKETENYTCIIISNGFVDYNKPYLYEYNNRLKKLRVRFDNSDEYMDFELEDTPQLQALNLNEFKTNSNTLELEILEVYKGTKYDDTCINFILTWGYNFYRH